MCVRMHMMVKSCCCIDACLFFFCYYFHHLYSGLEDYRCFAFTFVTLFNAGSCPLMCQPEVKYVHPSTKSFIKFSTVWLCSQADLKSFSNSACLWFYIKCDNFITGCCCPNTSSSRPILLSGISTLQICKRPSAA